MKQHKYHQLNFNLLGKFSDRLSPTDYKIIADKELIILGAIHYLTLPTEKLEFPAKSYAVALIYSRLLEVMFQDPFFESLNDSNLFCGNDKYFSTYSEASETYDRIINSIGGKESILNHRELPQIKTTLYYFSEEFGVDLHRL